MMNNMKSFKQFIIEAKINDVIDYWNTETESEINKYITIFNNMKNSFNLDKNEKDISIWYKKPFNDFKSFIDKKQNDIDIKLKAKGKVKNKDEIKQIYKNSKVTVYIPETKEAMCELGSGTPWCISKPNQKHYEKMIKDGDKIFVIVQNTPKNNNFDKVVFTHYGEGGIDIWLKNNKELQSDAEREQFFIDNNLEDFAIKYIDDWYNFFENFDDKYYN